MTETSTYSFNLPSCLRETEKSLKTAQMGKALDPHTAFPGALV